MAAKSAEEPQDVGGNCREKAKGLEACTSYIPFGTLDEHIVDNGIIVTSNLKNFYSVAFELGSLPPPRNNSEICSAAKLQNKDSIAFYDTWTSLASPTYAADTWPQHWEDKRKQSASKY